MKSCSLVVSVLAMMLLLSACSGQPGQASSAPDKSAAPVLPDTAKLKADLDAVMAGMANPKQPDTTAMKKTGADVLNTTADMLSDSGIDRMGGDDKDPGDVAARRAMKKMRDSMGINTSMLDSMRQSAQKLMPSKP